MPTKEDFIAYEEVRQSGEFNMFSPHAMDATGLDRDTYRAVMKNYSKLMEKYPDVRDLVRESTDA